MTTEPKAVWAKLVEQPYRFFLWLELVTLGLLALGLIVEVSFPGFSPSSGLRSVVVFVVAGLVGTFFVGFLGFFLALIPPLRPLFRWIVRRSAFLAVCLVTLVALAYAVENFRGQRAWERFKRTAEAKGEWFDVKSILPPPVPDEQNVVATPLFKDLVNEFDPEWRRRHTGPSGLTNESDRLKFDIGRKDGPWPKSALANWMIGRRTDLKAWQEYYRTPLKRAPAPRDGNMDEFRIAPQPQTPAADVLLALSKYDALLVELRAASARPHARFPIRYGDGFTALLPHLARLRGISQFLALRIAAELQTGLTNEAGADMELALRLADLLREEPLLISQLVRLAQLQLALNSLWEGLAEHRWTEAQLAGFQSQLVQFDFLAAYHLGMRGERLLCITAIDDVSRLRDPNIFETGSNESGAARDPMEETLGAVVFQLIPRGWFDQNKINIGRLHLELLMPAVDREARQVSPTKVNRLSSTLDQRLKDRSPYNWFGAMLIPALGGASARFAQGQASVDLARVACALERYRLAHGQYPASLDLLLPQLLPKLPHDVVNGRPLQYRRNGDDSFALYSLGWNETDEGGTAAFSKDKRGANWKEGDWVWRYPADGEEAK